MSRLQRIRSNTTDGVIGQTDAYAAAVGLIGGAGELPAPLRNRLYDLFGQIEKEFELLFAQNCALQAKVDALTEGSGGSGIVGGSTLFDGAAVGATVAASPGLLNATDKVDALDDTTLSKVGSKKHLLVGQRLKTALRVPRPNAGRLVQQFKVAASMSRARYVRTYDAHRDGVWHVDCVDQWMCSASADGTARIWVVSGAEMKQPCVATYTGHSPASSVNCCRFRTVDGWRAAIDADGQCLLVSASGDQSAHIWRAPLTTTARTGEDNANVPAVPSSEDELDNERTTDDNEPEDISSTGTIRQPLLRLTGHTGAVIAADWLCTGNQVITASWDRTANIYDAERGEIVHMLSGHDQELTFCHAHPSQRLVVTCSKDSTFRLCDFRENIHSVAVFQGHTDSVNAAILCANTDKAVSASDDRTVKVWDLRNMRAPLVTLRLDSPVNRLSVSRHGLIAIPHDNRHIRVYDLNGARLTRLPRSNHRCHRRMVCAAAWTDNIDTAPTTQPNLVTCAFDAAIIGWHVRLTAGGGGGVQQSQVAAELHL